MSENYLSVLTDDQLRGPEIMHNLQLDRNQLTCLDSGVISNDWASTLEIFTLNSNSFNTLSEFAPMPNLRVL